MNNDEFIKRVGDYAVKHYSKHKILPSLTIAQAILESSWGKSELAVKAHNYFGMKWTEGCGCSFYAKTTGEQRADGSYYKIVAKFRSYKTMNKGLAGYYKFIDSKPWYNNLKGVKSYKKACKLIKEDGWATSINYTKSLIKIIEMYNLTKYDEKAFATIKKPKVKTVCILMIIMLCLGTVRMISKTTKLVNAYNSIDNSILAQYEQYKGSLNLQFKPAYKYTDEDFWYLSHVIAAECGADWCKDETLFYVGSVVLNRVDSDAFPNTIREVVMAPGQYAPASYLANYEPSERVIEVTTELLEQGSVLPSQVVYHANFTQGSGVHIVSDTIYFCYK